MRPRNVLALAGSQIRRLDGSIPNPAGAKLLLGFLLALLLAACGSGTDATEVAPPVVVTVLVTEPPSPTDTPEPTTTPVEPEPAYPEPERVQTRAVHQPFERGDAIWLQDRLEIWVFVQPYTLVIEALATPAGPTLLRTGGPLFFFEDTFDPNVDPDADPDITPPEGFMQPKGGIGKLWRNDPELRAMLGWALEWETPYETVIVAYHIEPDHIVHTVLTSDGRLLYVHEQAGIWSTGE